MEIGEIPSLDVRPRQVARRFVSRGLLYVYKGKGALKNVFSIKQ